jgi:hypothetical protein
MDNSKYLRMANNIPNVNFRFNPAVRLDVLTEFADLEIILSFWKG